MSFTGLLIDSFTPQSVTRTTDNVGGYTESWADGTAFKGRLSALTADERLAADKITVYATHRLYCDYDSTLTEAKRITHSSRTFEIKGIRVPSNLTIRHMEIDLLEIE